jgi:hypothetical protein
VDPKGYKNIPREIQKQWFGSYRILILFASCNTSLLVTMDKFDPNPILANINKLKPCMSLEATLKGLEVQIQGGRDGKSGAPQKEKINLTSHKNSLHGNFFEQKFTKPKFEAINFTRPKISTIDSTTTLEFLGIDST